MKKINFKIKGMSCASCASSIESELKKVVGIIDVNVNFAMESGCVTTEPEFSKELIKKSLNSIGYSVSFKQEGIGDSDDSDSFKKFIISISLSMTLFFLSMWPLKDWPNVEINRFMQLFLCLPIWLWVGLSFQKSFLNFLITRKSNMNTLIGLGTSSAFFYSSFITIFNKFAIEIGLTDRVYFEAVGFIISFVYLGKYYEHKAKRKAKGALASLFKLSSSKAFRIEGDEVNEVLIDDVKVGEFLRVYPGSRVPLDGKVVNGKSYIDESMITGESLLVFKEIGSNVFSGTINGDGLLDIKVLKNSNETLLKKIIKFVEDAQNTKPDIQKYADKISSIFIPSIIVFAFFTLFFWVFYTPNFNTGLAFSNFIAVLVIACPCALGLATPIAVVVSTGRAALNGVLISGGDVIEKAVEIDTVIFDKTGTLTEGSPKVLDAIFEQDDLLVLGEIASIERYSEHSIAKSIVDFAALKNASFSDPDSFEVIKGYGVKAEINNNQYLIGSERFLLHNNICINKYLCSHEIGTSVFIAKNGHHIGGFIIGDKIKDSAKALVETLKEEKLQVWLVSGDNKKICEVVSKNLNIDHFMSEVLPLEKADLIEKLQKQGKRVAMIGDGVNDAPALSKANLSFAMGTGTDIAINASDVTILNGDIDKFRYFLSLSKYSMKVIKQNLFLSMVYNLTLVPLAAGILLVFNGPSMPPVLASIAMGLSSISVVLNSLKIRKY